MFHDWLRQNALAAVVGTAIGTAVIGGSVVYLVVIPPPAVPAPAAPAAAAGDISAPPPVVAFPMRFRVKVSGRIGSESRPKKEGGFEYVDITGEGNFLCDLTRTAEMSCVSPRYNQSVMASQIEIIRYAHDASRISMFVFGAQVDGITWARLKEGFTVRGTKLVGTEA